MNLYDHLKKKGIPEKQINEIITRFEYGQPLPSAYEEACWEWVNIRFKRKEKNETINYQN